MKPTQREVRTSLDFLAVMTGKKKLDDCKTLGKTPKKKIQREAAEQEALFAWAKLQENVYPELVMLYAIPNGGSRHILEAANLKKQGVKSGIPDICLSVARQGFHSLYIEMKSEKGKISENQAVWINKLRWHENKVEVCYSAESAINAIKQYLNAKQS